MRLRELIIVEDGEGGGAVSTSTTSSDIATVAFPLLVRGKNRKEKRKNARAAVGLGADNTPGYIGQGVYEGMDEAHTVNSDNVIYRLDRENPMSDTEVLVLGGAGRYTLQGLRDKARKEADALAQDLKVEHGGSFRRAVMNIKQLENTINTIVAAYNELARILRKGGRGSRGITDEDKNFVSECLTSLERYTAHVSRALNIAERLQNHLIAEGMNQDHVNAINGMYHLGVDPGYGFYRWSVHVAGNCGGGDPGLGANAGPFAYAYTDAEDEMIKKAVKAMGGKIKELTPRGSTEHPDVNKTSTIPALDWKKIK